MRAAAHHSFEAAALRKPVLRSRVLDEMNDPARWIIGGHSRVSFGGQAQVEVQLHSVELAGWTAAAASLTRAVPDEDWSGYNRLAFRVRPRMTGFETLTLSVSFRNDGLEKIPDVYDREGTHFITLPNNRWTEVRWEIGNLPRDRVTSFAFRYSVPKRIAAGGDQVSFDIGPVRLEKVAPSSSEGWAVEDGSVAFSHSGYLPRASKIALVSGIKAATFSVIDARTGAQVIRKRARPIKTRTGEFLELDFSSLAKPGRYRLRAGKVTTPPFRIGSDAWDSTIWKTINFFYTERCGFAVPGVHDVCHRDWQGEHNGQRIVINGGWHDAGDLSQALFNTAEATYAMFSLAAKLRAIDYDPVLVRRLIEEARWGLDWVLKVRFPGGYRIGFASTNIWTNGAIGDSDDRIVSARNNPNANYLAATAEAKAYSVLKDFDPELANRALRTAEEDWEFAIAGKETPESLDTPAFESTEVELAGVGVLASLELYEATGRERYAAKARELAAVLLASQQTETVGLEFPLSGFFYTSPAKSDLFHQFHRGNDQAPIVALVRLCQVFKHDPDSSRWRAAIDRYTDYQKKTAEATAPWRVLPAYVYREDEFLKAVDGDRYQSSRDAFREQVLNGMPMGGGYYLKAFPVWFGRRGNYGVLLSQTKALAAASVLRKDAAGLDLAHRQLEWVVGRNPFAQSTMWGEGYNFAQQYSVSSGDLVGSLPVGMMTRGNRDLPYWPPQNSYVYKEVWVHPSARWLWILEDLIDLSGPRPASVPKPRRK